MREMFKEVAREIFTEGMMAFGRVIGTRLAVPATGLQGVQDALNCTNQNLLQLAQVIEAQNKLTRQHQQKMTPESLGAKIDTLNSSIGDLRTEFASYCKRPASESQHDRTLQALQAVVSGISAVTRTLQDQGLVPQSPAVAKSGPPALYSDQEFERLVEKAKEGSTLGNGGKPLKTLEARVKKAPTSTVTSTSAKHPEATSTKLKTTQQSNKSDDSTKTPKESTKPKTSTKTEVHKETTKPKTSTKKATVKESTKLKDSTKINLPEEEEEKAAKKRKSQKNKENEKVSGKRKSTGEEPKSKKSKVTEGGDCRGRVIGICLYFFVCISYA